MASKHAIKRMYQCSGCDEVHEYESEAEICCAPAVLDVYVCPICDETHETEDEARECCPDQSATCPSCLREHMGNHLAILAIKVAGHCPTCNPFYPLEHQLQIQDLAWEMTGKSRNLND
ncbi:hypothetical protein IQ22_04674 [Pseudomonas duriflava]|uniref:Uncharacterized protein n=1 Tax=Pseudomonas duriflava TaxID=459528 RepID=A0A562PKP1_9PSED|nr:hypothetical protein IQ22_04674 [Pseudomonas duriflava]